MHIRVGDQVEVVRGDDRKKRGKVLGIDRESRTVIVEGVGRVFKHVKRTQKNPQGGRLSMEMPVSLANVRLVCEKCGQATTTGVRYAADGTKEAVCKACGAVVRTLSPARRAYAKA
jgi:large subunit ribosomal protein L24